MTLPDGRTGQPGRLRDPQQRAARATRILDTAADLLTRRGYRHVSIDDVAAGAAIGKGTVYLHWKTREQLFGAVFAREILAAVDELRRALRRDPENCLLHRFARTYFLAVDDRPLLRGFLLNDPDLLGRLTDAPDTGRDERHGATAYRHLELLAAHGLLRDDLDLGEIAYAYQATFEGFLRAGPTALDTGQRADLLARTVRRAFETGLAPTGAAPADGTLPAIAAATAALLDDLVDADRAEFGLPGGDAEGAGRPGPGGVRPGV
ncbi:TetR/AcrR family transcriptional regulator [Kitasatospora purpeofusca]|uniref:TetR/AcrR family transcriptional regulator n=1 Tax=Kitasatospora purpeofusca TaxID=67352 RepID=UPI002258DB26|nr:TetR/AcrR family transcriptional regulator [Kitasatospora purpeofusca]MCX4757089.1 TetR/AcrR family transcriptional regulator [Kitasatospora purpeofusca]WSR35149.1 TetR/AcrR family transcriptional regulator [Kitasatospora purpeofusca]WSR43469.1 TetR/AcrR family transcriptional regulator [Kitasatospora purpeofusca]